MRVFPWGAELTATSNIIAGVDFVTGSRSNPAVANMSLGGGASQALDDSVRASIRSGVTYVVAVGNSNLDTCTRSPARVLDAIVVQPVDPERAADRSRLRRARAQGCSATKKHTPGLGSSTLGAKVEGSFTAVTAVKDNAGSGSSTKRPFAEVAVPVTLVKVAFG